jgi:lysophospholipase L1-like esterase
VLENPHGILFNPVSVAEAIFDYIKRKQYKKDDLFYFNEGWHSWKHHSHFSALIAEESLQKINSSISDAHDYLKQADYLFITLGSAWIYKLTEKAANGKAGSIVANNHKAPADWFERNLLTGDDVLKLLEEMLQRLLQFNSKLKIIFTISPVRHLREGVIDNNRSKAALIQAVHQLTQSEQVYYFPAYELVLDDLRDYRFYSEDLVHPNYFATEYVWKRFGEACMNENTRLLMEEIHSINLAHQHKPFNPTSEKHIKFMRSYAGKLKALQDKHSYLDFNKELEYFNNTD